MRRGAYKKTRGEQARRDGDEDGVERSLRGRLEASNQAKRDREMRTGWRGACKED